MLHVFLVVVGVDRESRRCVGVVMLVLQASVTRNHEVDPSNTTNAIVIVMVVLLVVVPNGGSEIIIILINVFITDTM